MFRKLRGYDSHTRLTLAFELCGTDNHITAIPTSMEKFMTFEIGDVQVIDAFQLMASSLETLSDNLITQSTDNYAMFENVKNSLTPMS